MRQKNYDLLAIGDVGRELNRSTSAVRNWVLAGDLKCLIASDGSRLFTRQHIEDFKRRRAKREAAKKKARRKLAAMIEKELAD
jgi:hypothetical protein